MKWIEKTLPQYVEVFEGQSRYEIQLWWEIQPFVRSASASREPKARNEIKEEEEEEGARAGESVRSAGSRWEKTDGIEDVPSRREKLSDCLAQKLSGEDPRTDQIFGVGQVLGLIQRESRPGQLHGLALSAHHSPVQASWPRANMSGIGSDEPILRALGEFIGLAQSLFLD